MAALEKRQREYRDVLMIMNERTGTTIEAFKRPTNSWHVYEGDTREKEVTQELLRELERQRADLDYLINADEPT